jgi:phospholipid/cholesterol/gamma-HCH transport system substrate-binding protein
MKSNTGLKWKLGLFIICALVVLVLGLFFIGKQKNLFVSVFPLRTVFNNVSGLKPGNNVRLSGINIGTVESLSLLTDTSVMVNMMIKTEARKFLHASDIASIGSDGLMGDRVLLLAPGTGNQTPVKENDILFSNAPVETNQILSGLKTSADNAAVITAQLAEVAYKVNHGHGVLSRLLSDSSMGNNMHATMVNLKKGSEGLSENMEAAKHNFLLRGYFKKKKRAEDKKKQEQQEKKEKETQSGSPSTEK